jgi:glycosyltransferase involved in cell wall biosynthesis
VLSICIPIHNYDIRDLVQHLHRQATHAKIPFEILLVDDCSLDSFKAKNISCKSLKNVKWLALEKNVGRSRIRNLLAQIAEYPWLIFMDCDSQCPDDQYIQRYLEHTINDGIVCGGRIYHPTPPDDDTYLHWLFGTRREVKDHTIRARKPNHSFMTNNFMISAHVLKHIAFNESLLGYGHEDTLFGVELLRKNINIRHIHNPLIHVGLQNANEFLHKTKEGTRNLLKVYSIVKRDKALPEMVKLLKVWAIIRNLGLCRITGQILRYFEPAIVRNLKGRRPILFLLDLYKLGSICRQTVIFRKKLNP